MRELKPCGTLAAAVRHKRHGEPVCDACTAAQAAYMHDYWKTYRRAPSSKLRRAA